MGEIGQPGQELLEGLIAATGPADAAISRLNALDLPGAAREQVRSLVELVRRLNAAAPDLALTVDPGEFRGVEYHTGIAFAVFARGARGEICGGGRYRLTTGERRRPASASTWKAWIGSSRPSRSPRACMSPTTSPSRRHAGCEPRGGARSPVSPRPPIRVPRRAGSAAPMSSRAASPDYWRSSGRWPTSPWWAPSGAMRARARSSTGCLSAPTWWSVSRAATTPVIRWS